MTNRAEIYNPYPVDMFNRLETGTRVTFTDEGTPVGYYKVIPDNSTCIVLIPKNEINAYFKYYTQATIF
jgi:hypothetical protein